MQTIFNMIKNRSIVFILALLTFWIGAVRAGEITPLSGDRAFVFSAFLENPQRLVLKWQIAPGYYLYRDKLKIQTIPTHAQLTKTIRWPASIDQTDSEGGTFRAYQNDTRLVIPLSGKAHDSLSLIVQYQGCSHEGFCYAPMKKQLNLTYPFSAAGLNNAPLLIVSESADTSVRKTLPNLLRDQNATETFLEGHVFIVNLLCFLGLGLLLAFTPCSLPMIPILSSIIAGQQALTGAKAFKLSLAYVLGMALTYAGAGIAMAWIGSGVQAYFQAPWMIGIFSLVFVILAASMLGWFDISLPRKWQQKVMHWQQRHQGGNYFGVTVMGCLSTLVVSPCVTAPLVGVLAYVSDTGNLILGGSALFALGIGMGLPLLLLGFSEGKYLPRSGPWMDMIKKLFGFLLLGMAIWMLSRVLPGELVMFLWASLLISVAVFLFFIEDLSVWWRSLAYASATIAIIYGFILFVGVALSYESPFYLFEKLVQKKETVVVVTAAVNPEQNNGFTLLKNMEQLDALLKKAKLDKKPVVLDFFADWCESCQALEKAVLSQVEVKNKLKTFVLLRANVTQNNAFDHALLKRYHVIAPPTFLFINREGTELREKRIVGEVDHQMFLTRASAIE